MENLKYESPEFDFQEMKLMERVAATCWGFAYAWYDADRDGSIDGKEKVELNELGLNDNGCQGSAARDALKKYYKQNFSVELTDKDVSNNTESTVLVGSNS